MKEKQIKAAEEEIVLTEETTKVSEEVKNDETSIVKKGEVVKVIDATQLFIGERPYMLVKNHRDAFDPNRLGERFSDVLSRYDYIVGDWGYDQLRLKGFFATTNRKALPDQRIDTLEDYLYEYCNFGCAYFVIERVGGKHEKSTTKRKKNKKNYNKQNAHISEKTEKKTSFEKKKIQPVKQRKTVEKKKQSKPNKQINTEQTRSFTIRQREE